MSSRALGSSCSLRPRRHPYVVERRIGTCGARPAVPPDRRRHDVGLRRAERAPGADVRCDHQRSRRPRHRSRTSNCRLDCDPRRLDIHLAGRPARASRHRDLPSRRRSYGPSGTGNARHSAAIPQRSKGQLARVPDCRAGAGRRAAECQLGSDRRHRRRWPPRRRMHRRARVETLAEQAAPPWTAPEVSPSGSTRKPRLCGAFLHGRCRYQTLPQTSAAAARCMSARRTSLPSSRSRASHLTGAWERSNAEHIVKVIASGTR